MRGIIAGAFGLIVLQVLVSNPRASGAVGGIASGAANAVHWFLDPNTPAIPDRTQTASAVTTIPNATTPPAGTTTSSSPPLRTTLAGALPGEV